MDEFWKKAIAGLTLLSPVPVVVAGLLSSTDSDATADSVGCEASAIVYDVTDETDVPLAGARVVLEDHNLREIDSDVSDAAGLVSFETDCFGELWFSRPPDGYDRVGRTKYVLEPSAQDPRIAVQVRFEAEKETAEPDDAIELPGGELEDAPVEEEADDGSMTAGNYPLPETEQGPKTTIGQPTTGGGAPGPSGRPIDTIDDGPEPTSPFPTVSLPVPSDLPPVVEESFPAVGLPLPETDPLTGELLGDDPANAGSEPIQVPHEPTREPSPEPTPAKVPGTETRVGQSPEEIPTEQIPVEELPVEEEPATGLGEPYSNVGGERVTGIGEPYVAGDGLPLPQD